jgi:hypothetical protein
MGRAALRADNDSTQKWVLSNELAVGDEQRNRA